MPPAPPEAAKKPPPAPAKDAAKPDAAKAGGAGEKTEAGEAKAGAGKPAAGAEKQAAGERVDRMAVRAKMAVSAPGDAVEQEADRAADTVMRAMDAGRGPEGTPAAGTRPAITRAPAEAEAAKPGAAARPTVPRDFAQDLGSGLPLDAATRSAFERQFGRDFSAVRVHDDAKADAAARQIGARAFTLGQHIAFAGGQYDPGSTEGKRLLAHELAHVAQQGEGGVARMVMRNTGGGGAGGGASEFVVRQPLKVPPIKSRHTPLYEALAGKDQLRRRRGYSAAGRGTDQSGKWMKGETLDLGKIPADKRPKGGAPWDLTLHKQGGSAVADGAKLSGIDDETLRERLKRPTWDADGVTKDFQVDHMVEYQVGGADDMSNYELLDQASNGSVGPSFAHEIRRAIQAELADLEAKGKPLPTIPGGVKPDYKNVGDNFDVVFKKVEGRGRESGRKEGNSRFWSAKQIRQLIPVTSLLAPPVSGLDGKASLISLLSPTGGMLLARLPVSGNDVGLPAGGADAIAGFEITAVKLTATIGSLDGAATADGAPVGNVEGTLNLGPAVSLPADFKTSLPLQRAAPNYAVKIGSTPKGTDAQGNTDRIPATFKGLSRMAISGLAFGKGVYGRSEIEPSHPALEGLKIPGEIRNGRLGIFHTLDASALAQRMKVPGLSVDGASLALGYDGERFSAGGSIAFTIRNFGEGTLEAEIDTAKHFALEGRFRADPRLFDQGEMRLWYRSEEGFGGSGTLGINNPNKIKGIKSASVNARYEKGVLHADGTVQPAIPGVQSAGLAVTYGKDAAGADSLSIAGELQLAAGIPGLSGGSVKVTVVQSGEEWKVAASGTITPTLPGLSPRIELAYKEGVFDGSVSAAFQKSIFSGDVTVGLTNRAVSPEGELSGTEPGEALRLYGQGTVTAKVTPWLQGGVGIKVKPTGQLLISGKIGIPGAVTVFEQFPSPPKDRRTLFEMPTLAIPLLGAPGAGVSINITGRVEGYAHVGPGKLTSAEIGIEDFDPAQPDTLKVTGTGSFEVPATAGVDAGIDAGLAAGAVISLEAGLGVKAGIAAEAKAKTDVDVDWTAATGLHLHADLAASITPKLKFGVNGYVRVIAGAFGVSYELWRKDWTLAEKEAGGNLAIGVTAPVDYYSDGRGVVFDPEKVTFQVPSLDAETLEALINDSGTETTEEGEGAPPG